MITIEFLGTSNANPHPDRRQSGILLKIEEDEDVDYYLFDCGDGIPTAIWNEKEIFMNRIHSVFFSHRHADHIGGLMSLILLMHQRIKNSQAFQPGDGINREFPHQKNGDELRGMTIHIPGEKEQTQIFEDMAEIMHMSNFETKFKRSFHPFIGSKLIYKDSNIHVESFPTHHCIDSSGFKIFFPKTKKKVLYSGDIHSPNIVKNELGEEHWEFVIIENAHFPTKDITEALLGKNINMLLITHRRDSIIANPEKALADLEPLKKTMNVILAEDSNWYQI